MNKYFRIGINLIGESATVFIIAEIAQAHDGSLGMAIAGADYPTPARRPANSRLDTRLLRTTFGLHLPDWKAGFSHIMDQIL
jgi:dTDP-4-dehydrorhamnose reductase